MKYFRKILITSLMIVSLWQLYAQNVNVPLNLQVPIFVKLFQFERSLGTKNKPMITIAVLYLGTNRMSLNYKDEFVDLVKANSIKQISGKSISIISIDAATAINIENELQNKKVDILAIVPMRAYELNKISDICKNLKITTYTIVPEYLKKYNFSVTIDNLGEKPQININLNSAKREGADFSSQLLKISKILE